MVRPNQLTDFRDDLVHRLVRFAAIHFSLEPMPEPLNRIVRRALRGEMLKFQPCRFGYKRLPFLAFMNAAIIQNEHQQLIRKTRMQLMQEGHKGSGITPGSLLPIHPLTLKL